LKSEIGWHENVENQEERIKDDVNLEKHQCSIERSNETSMASGSRIAQADVVTDLKG
jgi:hypothetical protein